MKKILNNYSSKNDINIRQIVAYKDNVLEIEEYKDGFSREDTLNIMSVTKSITSLLIGIAIDKGFIKGINDKVMDYYKDIYIPKKGEKTIFDVTIRHLLTMTAPYKGKSEPWKKVCTSQDWSISILDSLGGRKGITDDFRYHQQIVDLNYYYNLFYIHKRHFLEHWDNLFALLRSKFLYQK